MSVLPVIDRYLLRQMAGPLLATLLVALLILLIERALRLLDTVLAARGSIRVLLEMLTYLVPHYLGLALPLSVFLAVLLTFSRLHRDHEMDALHAAGISLFRLARPVVISALLAVALSWSVFNYLQPFGRYAYRAAAYAVQNASILALLEEGVFTTIEGATVLVEEFSADGRQFARVFVHQRTADGESRVIVAPFARLEETPAGDPPVVSFFAGTDMRVPAGGEHTLEPAEIIDFETFHTPVGDAATGFRPRGKDERELTLGELWERQETPPEGIAPSELAAELHGRLVRIVSVAVLPLFALPFALGGRRRQHALRVAAGIAALVVYNELLQVGETMVAAGRAPPLVALWLPCALLSLACAIAVPVTALGPRMWPIARRRPSAGGPGTVALEPRRR